MMKTTLQQIKEKVQKYDQKKNEETISSVASDIKARIDELKSQIEKERQSFDKALSTSKKECENSLNSEAAKFLALWEKSTQATISKYKEKLEKLLSQHEQQREKEKSLIEEQEKVCRNKIAELEESLKKQDDKLFSIFRETLESILKPESDDDFQDDD